MDHQIYFSAFSQAEDSIYSRFQKKRELFFAPLCKSLTKMGVKPDYLSYFSLMMIIPFAYFLNNYAAVSFFALLLSVLADAVDGCLARHQKISSDQGALLDMAVDHAVLFSVVLTLIAFKIVDGFWGAAYALNYFLMVVLVMTMRSLKMQVFLVLRSKYYLYLLVALWIFTGLNFLDIFVVFFAIYMLLTNLFLFHKLRWAL